MISLSEKNKIVERTFITGDEWLYYKFYCGVKTADHLIRDFFKTVIDNLLSSEIIDHWFFIRYSDPNNHIRLRLHIPNKDNYNNIINLINQFSKPYIQEGIIWKIQTDTYNREIDRYGNNSIELIEKIFYYDSMMVMESLNLLTNENDDNLRWQFSLLSSNSFINCFLIDEKEKFDLCKKQSEVYGKEFGMNHNLRVQLDKKFRDNRFKIEQICNNKIETELTPFNNLNLKKLILCNPIISTLKDMKENNNLVINLNDIIINCNHMMFNRLFRTKQRVYEFVIYYLLSKHYESVIAKDKYTTIIMN